MQSIHAHGSNYPADISCSSMLLSNCNMLITIFAHLHLGRSVHFATHACWSPLKIYLGGHLFSSQCPASPHVTYLFLQTPGKCSCSGMHLSGEHGFLALQSYLGTVQRSMKLKKQNRNIKLGTSH